MTKIGLRPEFGEEVNGSEGVIDSPMGGEVALPPPITPTCARMLGTIHSLRSVVFPVLNKLHRIVAAFFASLNAIDRVSFGAFNIYELHLRSLGYHVVHYSHSAW